MLSMDMRVYSGYVYVDVTLSLSLFDTLARVSPSSLQVADAASLVGASAASTLPP